MEQPKILLGVTGSVAAVKAPEIAVRLVHEMDAQVRILLTQGGLNFWNKAQNYNNKIWNEMLALQNGNEQGQSRIKVYHTDDEWRDWNSLGDPVLHIEFRNWADLLLIAPLSAHTLAKLAHGLCDDGLSSVVRAWDFHGGGKPIVLAPAMNTAMWEHPLTQPQLRTLSSWSRTVSIVAPQVKELACGDVGNGALANVDEILVAVGTVLVTNAEKNL